jgi:hypothetical protein
VRQTIAIQSTHISPLHRDEPFSLGSPPHFEIPGSAVYCLRRAVSNLAVNGRAFPPIPCTNSTAAMQLIPEAARTVASWPSIIGPEIHRSVIPVSRGVELRSRKQDRPAPPSMYASRVPTHALPTISLSASQDVTCHLSIIDRQCYHALPVHRTCSPSHLYGSVPQGFGH